MRTHITARVGQRITVAAPATIEVLATGRHRQGADETGTATIVVDGVGAIVENVGAEIDPSLSPEVVEPDE